MKNYIFDLIVDMVGFLFVFLYSFTVTEIMTEKPLIKLKEQVLILIRMHRLVGDLLHVAVHFFPRAWFKHVWLN